MSSRIEVKGLQKSFVGPAGNVQVLSDVNMEAAAGSMTAIVGESGTGKTTLLHILGALDTPTGGQVLVDGKEVFDRPAQELDRFRNREVGFVFQFHHLIGEMTALENVALSAMIAGTPQNQSRDHCMELLERLGVAHRAEHLPGELSGGEQQRVAVARALLMNPSMVLADEPTGNLDHDTGERLFSLLMELNEELGITMIIVTHNERFAARMPHTLRLTEGAIQRIA